MRSLGGIARRSLAARPGRTLMTLAALVLAVALSVAVGVLGAGYSAHQLRTATARGGFFDINIRHFAPDQAAAVGDLAAGIPGVRSVTGSNSEPLLEFGPYRLLALAYGDLAALAPYVDVTAGRLPAAPGEAALEAWAARELGVGVGDPLPGAPAGGPAITVVGLVEELPGSLPLRRSWAVMSMATLEQLLGRPAVPDQVNLTLDPGASTMAVHGALAGALQGQARVDVNEPLLAARAQAASLRRILLAAVLFTSAAGVIVTLNTFQISVMERMAEIGVLKSQGVSRRQLAAMWRLEGLLLGALGGAAGTAGGLGLAALLARLAQRRLDVQLPALAAPWWVVPGGILLGIAIATLAAWIPARAAGRMSILAAMHPWRQEGTEAARRSGARSAAGSGMILAGLALVALFPLLGDEHPLGLPSGVGGLFLTVAGATALIPYLLPVLLRDSGSPGLGRLARANLLRHRRRTAVTMSTLLLGTTLLAFFAGVLQGQQERAERQLRARVPTDFVVEIPTFSGPGGQPGGLAPELAAAAGRRPEVAGFTTVKLAHSLLAGFSPAAMGGGRTVLVGIDPAVYPDLAGFALDREQQAALAGGQVAITERLAADTALAAGDTIAVRRAGRDLTFAIAGVVAYEAEAAMGAILIDQGQLAEIEGNGLVHRLLINVQPGADESRFGQQVRSLVSAARGEVIGFQAERERLQREAAEMLAYVSAMVGLVGLIGLSGIFNTFLASVRERTREIGVLKSLGVSRARISLLLCAEAAIMGLLAAALGTALGGMAALVAAYGLNGQWSAAYLPAPGVLLAVPAAAVALSVAASAWPARLAGALEPARLLRAE